MTEPSYPGAELIHDGLLYVLLARSGQDSAHSRYNALIRRLVSFERAAERAK